MIKLPQSVKNKGSLILVYAALAGPGARINSSDVAHSVGCTFKEVTAEARTLWPCS